MEQWLQHGAVVQEQSLQSFREGFVFPGGQLLMNSPVNVLCSDLRCEEETTDKPIMRRWLQRRDEGTNGNVLYIYSSQKSFTAVS